MGLVELIGWAFVAILALCVVIAVVMGIVSLPDARRYLRIRRM